MIRLVIGAIKDGNETVMKDVRRLLALSEDDKLPNTPQEMSNKMFHTIYMGTKLSSSSETRRRASELSRVIGSYHIESDIDSIVEAEKAAFTKATGFSPKFKTQGGSM